MLDGIGNTRTSKLDKKKKSDKDVIRTRAAEAIRLAGEPLHHSGTLPYDIIDLFMDLWVSKSRSLDSNGEYYRPEALSQGLYTKTYILGATALLRPDNLTFRPS